MDIQAAAREQVKHTYRHRRAIFRPKQLDSLKPELVPVIGCEIVVRFAYTLDDDHALFPGQAAYFQVGDAELTDYCWMPEEDLEFLDA